jgi:hypothetical protein
MLIGQPAPESVYPHFHRFISGSMLVAHNAEFDLAFIRQEFYRLGLSLSAPVIPTHVGNAVSQDQLGAILSVSSSYLAFPTCVGMNR